MTARLVIFDAEPGRKCAGGCHQIKNILLEACGAAWLDVREISQWGDVSGPPPELVILRVPAHEALVEALSVLRSAWPSTRALAAVCASPETFPDLGASLQGGLDDFVCCPFHEADLITRLRRLMVEAGVRSPARLALPCKLDMLVGESSAFWQAMSRIPQIAASTASVLVGGETGVGKELFARAIHYCGERKSRPFIPINCSALPDHLFENELFGHAKGAYTDAASSETGLLAEAEGGTVFLDEVDMLSHSAQAKLLRFLQDREYRPLGSRQTMIADARVIAASNADLRMLVAKREFREDLYYRLNVLWLRVPPLRERITDIPLLANHFLARFAAQYGRGTLRFRGGAMRKMLTYSWPGNVRELEAVLHRAVVFGTSDVLGAEDIELPETGSVRGGATAGGTKDHAMEEFERRYLMDLLAEHKGNVSHAARAAGKDRRTLQRLLRKYSIERLVFQASGECRTASAG